MDGANAEVGGEREEEEERAEIGGNNEDDPSRDASSGERDEGDGESESEEAEPKTKQPEEKKEDRMKKETEGERVEMEERPSSSEDVSEEEGEENVIDGGGGGLQMEREAAGQGVKRYSSKEERMKRLRELHKRRLEARQLNHREVVEEDRRRKLPANWESKQKQLEWEEADEKARKEAEEAGEDYERQKMLQTSAAELERLQRKKKRKNPDPGFSGYAQAQYRQYERLTKQLKPDMEAYEKQKMDMGEDFYPGVNSLLQGSGQVSQAAIDHMTGDLEKQIEKRNKFSRRRAFDRSSDVDYINERNMKFNKKAARFYDQYTTEIKQNLERGTAV